jgi:hypothetical protein
MSNRHGQGLAYVLAGALVLLLGTLCVEAQVTWGVPYPTASTGVRVVAPVAPIVPPAPVIWDLPYGYQTVYVQGLRYYTVGGVYYRPQFYGGYLGFVPVVF